VDGLLDWYYQYEMATRAEECAALLRRSILRETLPAGTRLPPERALAEQLGASRVSVRGALALLTGQGLLKVRQGQGYTVRDFRLHGGPGLLPDLLHALDDPRTILGDLQRIRRHLAAAALELIAKHRPDPAPLAEAVADLHAATDDGPDAVAAADLAATRALLALTGSVVLQVSVNPIITLMLSEPAFIEGRYSEPHTNAAGWAALLAWARDPDPAGIPLIVSLLEQHDAATLERLS
jgi:DNA-binding FadR family transcriptional regulator